MYCDSTIIRDLHLLKYWKYETPNSLAKPTWGCPFAPWRWATNSSRLAIPEQPEKHFRPCSQHSLLFSWFMLPCASCHWAKISQIGKLQRKWSFTRGLAGSLPEIDNGTESSQVSFLWSKSQQGTVWLCLSPPISQCIVTAGGDWVGGGLVIRGALQASAWVFSPVPALRDPSVLCLCLQEGRIFCALFQEMVNYGPARALVFATVGTSSV